MRTAISRWQRPAALGVPLIIHFLILCVPRVNAQVVETDLAKVGTLYIPFDASYPRDAAFTARLQKLVSVLPAVAVQFNGKLSEFTANYYNIGPRERPEAYAMLTRAILDLNGVTRPEELESGTLFVPPIPKRKHLIQTGRADSLTYYKYADLMLMASASAMQYPQQAFSSPDTIRYSGIASRGALVSFSLSATASRQMYNLYPELASEWNALSNGRLKVRFGDQVRDKQPSEPLLLGEEIRGIANILQRSGNKVRVFIVDTGWPSRQAQEYSINQLRILIDLVATHDVGLTITDPARPSFEAPKDSHSLQIAASLAEFEELDTRDRIQVIYVPMTRDQDSRQVLTELLTAHFLASLRGLIEKATDPNVRSQLIETARGAAASEVATLPLSTANGSYTYTSTALLNALWGLNERVRAIHIEEDKQIIPPYFINMSWVVEDQTNRMGLFPHPGGVGVAAAGNTPFKDILSGAGVDYAQRSLIPGDVVAVVNMGRSGKAQCATSVPSPLRRDEVLAVGYDGHIAGDACETSFATPRAAWLLALRSLARADDTTKEEWLKSFRESVMGLREKTLAAQDDTDYEALSPLRLNVLRLLSLSGATNER